MVLGSPPRSWLLGPHSQSTGSLSSQQCVLHLRSALFQICPNNSLPNLTKSGHVWQPPSAPSLKHPRPLRLLERALAGLPAVLRVLLDVAGPGVLTTAARDLCQKTSFLRSLPTSSRQRSRVPSVACFLSHSKLRPGPPPMSQKRAKKTKNNIV